MKSKKVYGLAVALLLSMIAARGLRAQTLPSDILESAQSFATQGRFRSAADDFIRTDSYAGVRFNKFFSYAAFNSSFRGTFGYAGKIGGAYLGLYYGGNFWAGVTPFNYLEVTQNFSGGLRAFPTYGILPEFDTGRVPDNRVAILLGIADMGFRLSYAWSNESFNKSDIAVVDTSGTTLPSNAPDPAIIPANAFYKTYRMERGFLSPQIEWAMAKPLTESNGIQPKVTLNLYFWRDNKTVEEYERADGSTLGEQIIKSENFFSPHLIIAPNGFHVFNRDGFRLTVDLDYELTLRIYNNEFSYMDGGNWKTDTIGGINTGYIDYAGSLEKLSEDSYINNLFTPSLAGQWSGEKLALRFKLNLPIAVRSTEKIYMLERADSPGELVREGRTIKSTLIDFHPNLRLATQWRIIPDKLTLNAGARLDFSHLTSTTARSSLYTGGDQTDSTKGVTTTIGDTDNNIRIGVTFMPTENMTFEASCGVGTNNAISVFNITGLLNFTRLLVSVRF